MLHIPNCSSWCEKVPFFFFFKLEHLIHVVFVFVQLFLLRLILCLSKCNHRQWPTWWKAFIASDQVSFSSFQWLNSFCPPPRHWLLSAQTCHMFYQLLVCPGRVGSARAAAILGFYPPNQPSRRGISALWLCRPRPEVTDGALYEWLPTVSSCFVFFHSPTVRMNCPTPRERLLSLHINHWNLRLYVPALQGGSVS